jgi:predicted transcriptional regulator of viral defense system
MSNTREILSLARKIGVISLADARNIGVHHEYLRRMCADGLLVRTGRGFYSLPDADITIHHGLAQAAKAVPKGIVCLLSALCFHEIGTQAPYEAWMAIDRRAALPRVKQPKLRTLRFSGKALSSGVQEQTIEGVRVRIYGPAKTVADCFKYRNKIGLDVAMEALREALRERKCTMDELWCYAKTCRVANVMRPFMEAMA